MFSETTNSVVNSLSTISADVFGILGAILLLVALGASNGKDFLIALFLSLYPAALVTLFFPYYGTLLGGEGAALADFEPLLLFFLTLCICVYILKNYVNTAYQSHTFWRFLELITLSITTVGLLIALLYHIVGVDNLYNFSIIIDSLFASPLALWLWFLAPLVNIPLFVRV